MISALFIFNNRGDPLISRVFREGVRRNVSDVFRVQVISKLSDIKSPVLTLGSTSFLHLRLGNLWFVAVTRDNADASEVFEFLHQFVDTLKALVLENGRSAPLAVLAETDITNNFVAIYEILDRVLDYGHIQNWDTRQLQTQLVAPITKSKAQVGSGANGGHAGDGSAPSTATKTKNSILRIARRSSTVSSTGSDGASGPSSAESRQPGVRYKKNELLINISEEVTLLMSPGGEVARAFVEGTVRCDPKLSGMPTCSFALVNTTGGPRMSDCNFHNCVSLEQFDAEGIVTFTPPDHEFELMRYRSEITSLPFLVVVDADILTQQKMLVYRIRLKSQFPSANVAQGVVVHLPTTSAALGTASIDADSGKAKFSAEERSVNWRFKKYVGGGVSHDLAVKINLAPGTGETVASSIYNRPPITMEFLIDGYSASLYRIQNLKVTADEKYSTVKAVHYCTRSKSYEIRQ